MMRDQPAIFEITSRDAKLKQLLYAQYASRLTKRAADSANPNPDLSRGAESFKQAKTEKKKSKQGKLL
jgi:hypothetical protein